MDAPLITPSYSCFATSPQEVTITSDDPDATIRVTTDGSVPDLTSPVYSGSFSITTSTLVQAIAIDSGVSSPVATSYIQIDPTTANVSRDDLIVWLKGDNGVSTSFSNVIEWIDVSGNENNASQSNSSNQPTYVGDAINDLPAVFFSGSAQFLQFPSGFADFTAGASIFIVLEPTGFTQPDARIFDLGDNSDHASSVLFREPTSTSFAFDVYDSSSGLSTVVSSDFTQNTCQLIEAIHDGSSTATVYTNGIQGAQNTSMNAIDNTTRTGNYVGRYTGFSGWFFEGLIAELFIYNRALSDLEREAIENYVHIKYFTLPTPPPLITLPSGSLSKPSQVAICGAYNGTVFFTVDGSTPTTSDTIYSAPLNVYHSQTIQAIDVVNGVASNVSSATYTLDSIAYPAPVSTNTTALSINLDLPTVAQ